MRKWWQDQPLVIGALQAEVEAGPIQGFNEYVAKWSYNTEQLLHPFAFKSKDGMFFYLEEKHGKILDEYLENAKGSGVKMIVYTNTHCLPQELGNAHPEYVQLDRNGNPYVGYSIYPVACINPRGAFHKEIVRNLKELCRRDIGGIFFDGPLNRGCYCKTCQEDFEKRFGHSIFDATPYEFNKMRVDIVTEHIKTTYETVKSINPNILLYLNNSALRPDVTGSNPRELYNYVDIMGAEGGFYPPNYDLDSLWHTSAFMKHLECVIGDPIKEQKPIVNFISGNDSGISYQQKTAGETAMTYAKTLANGGNIWYGFHIDALKAKNMPSGQKAKEYNEYIMANKGLYKASKNCAKVAVMWSADTANYYASSVAYSDFTDETKVGYKQRGDHRTSLFGVVNALERCHIPFNLIDETSIARGELEKYDCAILPTVACMSDDVAKKIETYVENGGKILANFDVGMYHEDGTFAGKSKLEKVFGFKNAPTMYATSWASTEFVAAKDPVLAPVFDEHYAAPVLYMKWDFEKDVKVLTCTHPPMDSVYGKMPEERFPAYVTHKYGKGCAYYLNGTHFETVAQRNKTAYRKLVQGFVECNSKKVIACEDKGLYEVVLRRQEDKYLLHIVNITGAMERPIEKVLPLSNLPFTLHLDGFGIEKENYQLSCARGGKLQNVSQENQTISFTLDTLNEYEVVVIE